MIRLCDFQRGKAATLIIGLSVWLTRVKYLDQYHGKCLLSNSFVGEKMFIGFFLAIVSKLFPGLEWNCNGDQAVLANYTTDPTVNRDN